MRCSCLPHFWQTQMTGGSGGEAMLWAVQMPPVISACCAIGIFFSSAAEDVVHTPSHSDLGGLVSRMLRLEMNPKIDPCACTWLFQQHQTSQMQKCSSKLIHTWAMPLPTNFTAFFSPRLIHLLQYTFVDELTRVAVFLLGIGRLKLKGLVKVSACWLWAMFSVFKSCNISYPLRREICGNANR